MIGNSRKDAKFISSKNCPFYQSSSIKFQVYYFVLSLFRETKEKSNFIKSVHSCLGSHYHKTPFQGLMPIGKLRCLRNRFAFNETLYRPNIDDFCGRYFRVNGIKDNQGVWREHPSGIAVKTVYLLPNRLIKINNYF